jgi:hypothetical protein
MKNSKPVFDAYSIPGVSKFVSKFNATIKEVRMKVTGEIESKKAGDGYVDVTVKGTKVRAWATVKGRDNVVRENPAYKQLEGCRVGNTVEAEIAEKTSNGVVYKNLAGIVLQNSPGDSGESEVVRPDRQSGSTERLYVALVPALYRMVGAMMNKCELEYLSENHERISAIVHVMFEHALDHLSGLKNTVGE